MKKFIKLAIIFASVMVMSTSCGVLCIMEDILMGCPPPPPPRHHYHHHHHHHHHGYHHHWCDAEELAPMNDNIA